MSATSGQTTGGHRRWMMGAALVLATTAMAGCDQLLEVELPDAVTDQALTNPATAHVQVNSAIALIECAYSGLAIDAAGYEDNFQRVSGVAGGYSEYETTPGGGCSGDTYSSGWGGTLQTARGVGYNAYEAVSTWTSEQLVNAGGLGAYGDREELLATAATYNALLLSIWGEHYCESVISTPTELGPALTPAQTLAVAEQWADDALGHIAAGGDFSIDLGRGQVTSSAETLVYGIRARIRWAAGDLTGAASDAAQVPDGFYAWILREDNQAETARINLVSSMQSGGGGVQAAGFLQGPVSLRGSDPYGISFLGNNPVTGQAWPSPVPFTGYIDLAIAADGRAVDADGHAITLSTAGSVADPRVPHIIGNTAGGPDYIPQKYPSLGDDIPLINWQEMRLIRAEAEGGAAAVGHVNAVRNGTVYVGGAMVDIDLPDVTYVPANASETEDMIIEERRRALFEEARFWATKTLNPDKLWFPRNEGQWENESATYNLGGGVRVLLPGDEYDLNLGLEARGQSCDPTQAPIFN